ncbi:hypothetical protein [Methylobacterium sp. Leaf108]|uniref:hypothetical protein n=1 Tax=Methylobacterium sp. Leaf108 TaxID=1736256 RepID=UPI0012E92A3E|nr:hypothetical protein [Methylobacterium sp. Leaf108]
MAGLASLVALAGIAFRGGAGGETLNPFTQVGRFKTETVYFRLVVDLTFDKAPVTVDVVVACGQHRTQSRAHGGTNETLGMSAYVYAVRLPGDHAVKVRTVGVPGAPNPCSGDTTANGRVPKNWLPLVVWYERADELAHGLGYADQDAYASPIARLGFRGARVETANAEDFERFLQTGPKNLVPPYLSQGMCCQGIPFLSQGEPVPPEYLARPEKAWRFAGTARCRGVRRVRLSESQRETIRALWPKERPDRWQPPAEGEYDLMLSISQNTPRGGAAGDLRSRAWIVRPLFRRHRIPGPVERSPAGPGTRPGPRRSLCPPCARRRNALAARLRLLRQRSAARPRRGLPEAPSR